METEDFNIYEFIEATEVYLKFYKEFVLNFNSYEVMETSIKLTINVDSDEYLHYGYDYYGEYFERRDYDKLIRDIGLHYGIYKNKQEYEKDYHNNDYIYYLKIEYPEFYEKLKEKDITDEQICDDATQTIGRFGIKWDTCKLAKKYKLYNFLRKKYVIFDINELIEYSFKFYRKFYNEFLLKFKNTDEIEKEIRQIINLESYKFRYLNSKNNIGINYCKIIRELGIEYHVYRNQKEMRKDYSMSRSN